MVDELKKQVSRVVCSLTLIQDPPRTVLLLSKVAIFILHSRVPGDWWDFPTSVVILLKR